MNIPEEDFIELYRNVKGQRDLFRSFIEDIVSGVPKFHGMASDYRHLSFVEIKDRARELLND